MNKGIKTGLIIFGIVGLGIGIYFIAKPKKGKKENGNGNGKKSENGEKNKNTTSTTTTTTSTVSEKYTDNSFPLKLYSGGTRVYALQRFLNSTQNAGLTVDGKFGPLTESAVKAWPQNLGGSTVNMFQYALYVRPYEDPDYVPLVIAAGTYTPPSSDLENIISQNYQDSLYHLPSTTYVAPNYNPPLN